MNHAWVDGSAGCSHCGTRYSELEWSSLSLVERLEPLEVARNVLAWPTDLCIEVRACGACGRRMAKHKRWQAGGVALVAMQIGEPAR